MLKRPGGLPRIPLEELAAFLQIPWFNLNDTNVIIPSLLNGDLIHNVDITTKEPDNVWGGGGEGRYQSL